MTNYIKESLYLVEKEKEKKENNVNLNWYSKSEKETKPYINNKDISLLVDCIQNIVKNDF